MAKKQHESKDKRERGGAPSQAGERVAQFFKKNIYIILMIVCILAIATMITVAVVVGDNGEETFKPTESGDIDSGDIDDNDDDDKDDDDDDDDTDTDIEEPQEFVMADPIAEYTLGQTYSDTELVYNPTHGHWATHEGVDFMAAAGTDVMSVFDGTVKSITTDSYYGTTVVIAHQDGFESVYKLLDEVSLKEGDSVEKGQVIGKVSGSALAEVASGAHLHLELYKDGEKINPMDYMLGGDK